MSSLIYFDLTSTEGSITLPNEIQTQEIHLEHIRVEFASAANALAAQTVFLDVPWLSQSQIVGNQTYKGLPIMVNNAVVTIRDAKTPIFLQKPITEFFTYKLSGPSLTGFTKMSLTFSHKAGQLV